MADPDPRKVVDFSNTEIAFSNKTDQELKKTLRLFQLMNQPSLVSLGSKLGMLAIQMRLPFSRGLIKRTIFDHFCGGENLLDCQKVIDKLFRFNTLTILDYGAEAKTTDEEIDQVVQETIRAIELAASNNSVPVVSTKMTALADNDLLVKMQEGRPLDSGEEVARTRLIERIELICARAHDLSVGVFVDAEESWLQQSIDHIVEEMMAKYNRKKVVLYNTYQMYRHDRLAYLHETYEKARRDGYLLGAKIVRGAYMEKERERANELGYPSPIQPDKAATDRDYNEALRFCVERYEHISSCNATHNVESNRLQAELIDQRGIRRNHPHLNFCQLLGMSDNITFNLAEAGFNVAKYLPYGPVREVVPYLIRRAQENMAVTGEMSRELKLIREEIDRRGL